MDEFNNDNKTKKKSNKGLFKGIIIGVVISILVMTVSNNFSAKTFANSDNPDKKLKEIENIINSEYVEELTDEQINNMNENIYRGYVAGVQDVYTTYMDKDSFELFMQSTNGQYAGIGASVTSSLDDNKVTIVTPFPNSPAEKVGLVTGDKILTVDGQEIFGDALDTATSLLKGEEGTTCVITVLKADTSKVETITVTRGKIDVPTISYEMLDNKTGYIRITSFDRVTLDQYNEALEDLKSQNMESLILDLRDNPGGLLDVVCAIADSLVPEGTIVYTEDRKGKQDFMYSKEEHLGLPMTVLINEYSASASEVLACAIKDHKTGTIVGETSYGKGVVQSLYPLRDGSALKVTISKYYSPNGYSINGVGLEPDVLVEYDEMENGSTYNMPFEEDVQLQKAYELLNPTK